MKTIAGFLFILFASFAAFAGDTSNCAAGKIISKKEKNIVTTTAEICQNEYSQFFTKNCADGCEFSKALSKHGQVDIEDATVGSPGGQICKELGFEAQIVEIEFRDKKNSNVDVCFSKDKSSFVSTGFLRDLEGDLEK